MIMDAVFQFKLKKNFMKNLYDKSISNYNIIIYNPIFWSQAYGKLLKNLIQLYEFKYLHICFASRM